MPHALSLSTLLFALLTFHVTAAWGSVVAVSPIRVHLSPSKRSEVIELKNTDKAVASFQVTAHTWQETADGEMKLAPTRDVMFFPSLVEVRPGETRRIRVASNLPAGRSERSYRMIIEELPPPVATTGAVKILTRLNIPVFVQPAALKPKPALTAAVRGGQLVVSVENPGNAYFKVQSLRIVARNRSGAAVFDHTLTGWYVLSGGRRIYNVDIPKNVCPEISSVVAKATTETGNASTTATITPGAACAAR